MICYTEYKGQYKGQGMNNQDNFDDGFLDYMIYQEVTGKNESTGNGYRPKSGGHGCAGLVVIILLALGFFSLLGSCGKSSTSKYSRSSYSSSYSSNRSYSNSSSTYKSSFSSKPSTYSSGNSYGGYSGTRSKTSSSDPYNAKSYAHPDDLYYDYPDDFWEYEDAEEYWEEHQDD